MASASSSGSMYDEISSRVQDMPRRVVATLLPKDFPSSVKPGYSRYATGQMIGAVASSAGGVMSMQVCAAGVVGFAEATLC